MVATPGQPQNLPHWLLVKSSPEQQSAGGSSASAQQPEQTRQPVSEPQSRNHASKPSTPIRVTPASPYGEPETSQRPTSSSSSNDVPRQAANRAPKDEETPATSSFAAMYGQMKRQRQPHEYTVAELKQRQAEQANAHQKSGQNGAASPDAPLRASQASSSEPQSEGSATFRRSKLTSGDTFPQARTILRGSSFGTDSTSGLGSNYSTQPPVSRHSEESTRSGRRSRGTADLPHNGNDSSQGTAEVNSTNSEDSRYISGSGFSGAFVGSEVQPVHDNVESIAQARESRSERRRRQEREALQKQKLNGASENHKEENVSEGYRPEKDSKSFSENIGSFPTSRGRMNRYTESSQAEHAAGQQPLSEKPTSADSYQPSYGSGWGGNGEKPAANVTPEPQPFVPPQTNPSRADSYQRESGYSSGFNTQPHSSAASSRDGAFPEKSQGSQSATTPEHHVPESTWHSDASPSSYVEQPPVPSEPTVALQKSTPTADEYMAPPTALDQSILINPVRPTPKTGWRKLVHTLTAGYVNLGESEKTLRRERLVDSIRTPLRGDYRIAVLSLKGGVGKTTTSVMLGGVFATVRGDRVIAIDANPDLGTLAQRAALPGSPTIRDLLNANDVSRYSLIKNYTTQAESRLEVIGSDRDPEVSEAFSEKDYRHAIDILQHHYNIILTDCGTGLMHSAMSGVLDLANTLIVVTSTALDGAQSASATLDWLNHHGYEKLVSNAIVVISSSQPGTPSIDVNQLMEHFRARTRAAHLIPFDRHLSEGAMIDLDRLERKTFMAYLELAGLVAHDFPNWHKHANSHE